MRASIHYERGMPFWKRGKPPHLVDSLILYRVSVPQLGEELVCRRLGAGGWTRVPPSCPGHPDPHSSDCC